MLQKNMPFLGKKAKPLELVVGFTFTFLIIMGMNKTIPAGIENILMSVPGMISLLVFVFVLFSRPNKVLGVLGIILIFLLVQNPASPVPANGVLNKVKIADVKKAYSADAMKAVSGGSSLEEQTVARMLPMAAQNNISQPKYVPSDSTKEIYKMV